MDVSEKILLLCHLVAPNGLPHMLCILQYTSCRDKATRLPTGVLVSFIRAIFIEKV